MIPHSITAFFPAYNDAGTIGDLVITAMQTLSQITPNYEVLVVNDGSTDHTAKILNELAYRHPRLRVIHHDRNRGYGAALRTGFANARKEWVFYTDGDGQYNPRELLRLVRAVRENVDVVNGYKIFRSDPFHRAIIGRLYHYAVRLAFGFRLRDVDCDFRLIRRQVLESVPLESDTGVICLEMVKKFQDAGCRFVEVPVCHWHRVYGKSQFFQFRRLCRVAVHLMQLWYKLVIRRAHLQTEPTGSPSLQENANV
ncbi:MAG: glycosyltransferase family 2 protein [Verrucomicrobia bacterium]|nr:glycosyltransferase family 2 protein [Verrucomicrobiota bacterium]